MWWAQKAWTRVGPTMTIASCSSSNSTPSSLATSASSWSGEGSAANSLNALATRSGVRVKCWSLMSYPSDSSSITTAACMVFDLSSATTFVSPNEYVHARSQVVPALDGLVDQSTHADQHVRGRVSLGHQVHVLGTDADAGDDLVDLRQLLHP